MLCYTRAFADPQNDLSQIDAPCIWSYEPSA